MKARTIAGALLGLSLAACGSDSASEPVSPPIYPLVPGPNLPPGFSSYAVRSGSVPVSGRLDGQLHGIELAADTTDNAGSFEVWEAGGGMAQLNIAANGTPSGAGMLIVSFMGTAFEDVLESGTWSGDVLESDEPSASTIVSSCAGPAMGEWPYELPAASAVITATEEPERPGSVVLVVKGQFPAAHLGADVTSELVGTFRFDRFD